jgi:hypothetical protein
MLINAASELKKLGFTACIKLKFLGSDAALINKKRKKYIHIHKKRKKFIHKNIHLCTTIQWLINTNQDKF